MTVVWQVGSSRPEVTRKAALGEQSSYTVALTGPPPLPPRNSAGPDVTRISRYAAKASVGT